MKEKVTDLKGALRLLRPGDKLALGGVGRNRAPMALVMEIIREGIGDLHLIGREKGMDFDLLIGAGLVRKVSAAYVGLEEFGFASNFRRAAERGEIEVEEHTCGTVISALRAGAMGLPFLPMKGVFGSDLMKIHDDFKEISCPFTGERLLAVQAIVPDVAVIHAQRADRYGNVQLKGSLFEDVIMIRAARRRIVTVEEIIPHEEIKARPEETTIPYFLVDAVVEVPRGAHPTSCYLYYGSDRDHMAEYAGMSRTPEGFREYLERYVLSVKDHEEYLRRVGGD